MDHELEKLEISLLLDAIYRWTGYDFREYAYSSIRRRIWHRVHSEKLKTISSLLDRVLHDSETMKRLISDFSIRVTEMFRDPGFFKAFRTLVVPFLRSMPTIRIWHAGCSTGEEVYSMAILLYEEGLYSKASIYGTDIHEPSLEQAKKGVFPLNRMQDYTKNYIRGGGTNAFCEYYSADKETVAFEPFLSENIVFAQHNLTTDGSFNEFHVIICRNVMIYFNRQLQERVHKLFYQSLTPSGILGLGCREGIVTGGRKQPYEEIDGVERLYRKVQ